MERKEATTKPATAAAEPARRTRLVRVDQEIIDLMLKEPPPRPSLPVFSDEVLERLRMPGLGPMMARVAAAFKRSNDLDADILHQYRTKGYAEIEEELTDGEEEV